MGKILSTFLLMIIGLALTPTIQTQVNAITGAGTGNLTGAALAIAGLIPLFWIIIIIGVGLAAIYHFMK